MAYELIQARNFTKAFERAPSLIVLHTMENPEKPGTARAVAKWFASTLAPKASAHYCVDANEIIQCVREFDVAWGAPNANRNGIHIEHAGRASQDVGDWHDAYSTDMLQLSSRLAAEIAFRYAIPLKWLSPDEVRCKHAGICDHWTVTRAFNNPGGHVDCGPNFPRDEYIAMVQAHAAKMNEVLQDG